MVGESFRSNVGRVRLRKIIAMLISCITFSGDLKAEELEEDNPKGQSIYQYKSNQGSILLTNRSSNIENLTIEKKTYYPPTIIEDKWGVNCSLDRFNGKKSCYIYKHGSNIFVYFTGSSYSVLIGSDQYPNSSSAVKIDNNATFYGHEGVSNTPIKVIEQMKKGKITYTRYREWPYDFNKDGEVNLEGFSEAIIELREKFKKL